MLCSFKNVKKSVINYEIVKRLAALITASLLLKTRIIQRTNNCTHY